MRVRFTFEFNELARKAINHHYIADGELASRDTLVDWLHSCVDATMSQLILEYEKGGGDEVQGN